MKSTESQNELIVCPDCGGQLAIWQEMSLVYSRKIHPKTGAIMSRINKSEIEKADPCGIKCTVCEWNESANDYGDEAQAIADKLNTDGNEFD